MMKRSTLRSEEGASLPFIAIMLPVLFAFVGLAYDGGSIFVAKREALNVASASARAGAADITEESLYDGLPQLAPSAAGTGANFARSQGYDAAAASVGGDKVRVTVRQDVSTEFLSLVGIDQVTVTEQAIAQVQSFAEDS